MNTLSMSDRPFAPADYSIAAQVSSYWANFAASGDPNGQGLPVWRPVRAGSAVTMEIGDTPGPIALAADAAKLDFWRQQLHSPPR
jgi:carboxylesterase type B